MDCLTLWCAFQIHSISKRYNKHLSSLVSLVHACFFPFQFMALLLHSEAINWSVKNTIYNLVNSCQTWLVRGSISSVFLSFWRHIYYCSFWQCKWCQPVPKIKKTLKPQLVCWTCYAMLCCRNHIVRVGPNPVSSFDTWHWKKLRNVSKARH